MRQRAKPFTVEVKKSRKASAEPHSLFGIFDARPAGLEEPPPTAAGRAADKLFSRPADAELTLADQVFGAPPAAERPATRILPDLTARPLVQPERDEEAPKSRMQRAKRPAKVKPARAEAVAAKPVTAAVVRAPLVSKVEMLAPRPVRVRPARRNDSDLLPRGERWKRRLTRFAR